MRRGLLATFSRAFAIIHMKSQFVGLMALLISGGVASATVTLYFNNAFSGGVSSNLANKMGAVTNDMYWGIIVDSGGNGFRSTYDNYLVLNSSVLGTRMNLPGGTGDDILIFASDLTFDTSSFTEGDLTTTGADGGVTGIADIYLSGGINAGDAFILVWFGGTGGLGGQAAGSLGDPSFVIPSDGSATDFDVPFVGVDPVRTSGFSYVGTSETPVGPGIFFAGPEPSTFLLGSVGALVLLRRRRA